MNLRLSENEGGLRVISENEGRLRVIAFTCSDKILYKSCNSTEKKGKVNHGCFSCLSFIPAMGRNL